LKLFGKDSSVSARKTYMTALGLDAATAGSAEGNEALRNALLKCRGGQRRKSAIEYCVGAGHNSASVNWDSNSAVQGFDALRNLGLEARPLQGCNIEATGK